MSRNEYEYDAGTDPPRRAAAVERDPARDALARRIATVVAATFVVVGILGFVPGITQDVDLMEFSGHESGAELFGIFEVSVLHNIVHLLFGVVASPWRAGPTRPVPSSSAAGSCTWCWWPTAWRSTTMTTPTSSR